MTKTALAKRPAERQLSLFDYGDLAVADVKRCEAAVERITKSQRRMAGDIIAIGKELLAVKDRLEHGQFGQWIKHYFGWSQPTASRMMQAAETFKEFNLNTLTVDTSALYLLSSNRCPDELREELIERAEGGERITHATVKQALSDLVDDGDDEQPKPHRNGIRAGSPAAPVIDEATTDELVEWSLGEFIVSVRRTVERWRGCCPEDQVEDMAQVLRDLAAQIENVTIKQVGE